MEQEIITHLKKVWVEWFPSQRKPGSFVFMKIHAKLSSKGCIVALVLDAKRRKPVMLIKIPRNPSYPEQILREVKNIDDVVGKAREDVFKHVPSMAKLANIAGQQVLFQTAFAGHSMVREMTSFEKIKSIYPVILQWMTEFHLPGAQECTLDSNNLDLYISKPIQLVQKSYPELYSSLSENVQCYFRDLPGKLVEKKVKLVRQHGDFNAHNILLSPTGFKDFFVIDWEDYNPRTLPIHDLNHFFMSNSKIIEVGSTGKESFSKFILNPGWYRDLYEGAIKSYAGAGIIDEKIFWQLTPLYLISMCLKLKEKHREQEDTATVWFDRAESFIETFKEKLV